MDELLRQLPSLIARELTHALSEANAAPADPPSGSQDGPLDWHHALLHYLADGRLPPYVFGQAHESILINLKGEAQSLSRRPALAMPADLDFDARNVWMLRLLQLLDEQARAALCEQTYARTQGRPLLHLSVWLLKITPHTQPSTLRLQAALLARLHGKSPTEDDNVMKPIVAESLRTDAAQHALLGATEVMRYYATRLLEEHARASSSPTANPYAANDDDGTVPPSVNEPAIAADAYAHQAWIPGEALLVEDAGLVWLYPFLPGLFAAMGVVARHDKRIAAEHLARAASLLHWLATGREEVFEFELGLSKVLLGLSPHDALPISGGLLTDADRAQATAALNAAIEHWPALGQTSTSTLRESFLQRKGVIGRSSAGWRLHIDAECIAVPLNGLSSPPSTVQLPWLTVPLFVTWQTR